MGYSVLLEKHYYHPRTHKRISGDAARLYMRRTGRRIKAQLWLVTRHTLDKKQHYISERSYLAAKKIAGRIEHQARLTTRESILKTKSLSGKRVREVLANHRVFHRLYEDFKTPGDIQRRGAIKMTVNGTLDGRHIREVIHLGFNRSVHETRYGSEERARESFKNMVTASILSNLRRRGLRTSDPAQSAQRIRQLEKDRQDLIVDKDRAIFMEDVKAQQKIEGRIKWHDNAIAAQKKSRQLRGVTLNIEKLV